MKKAHVLKAKRSGRGGGTFEQELGSILPRCAVLVGGARVDDDTVLEGQDVVDVLPPFAGG